MVLKFVNYRMFFTGPPIFGKAPGLIVKLKRKVRAWDFIKDLKLSQIK